MDTKFDNIPLFEGLSDEILQLIEPLFEPCTCHEGIIFEQGEPAVHLYLVVEGSVDILYKPYDAPPLTITNVKPGGIFGWSAIAGNTVYTSGAACHEVCKTMRVRGSDLRKLSLEHPKAGEILLDRIAESVSRRWQNAHTQVRDILSIGISSEINNL